MRRMMCKLAVTAMIAGSIGVGVSSSAKADVVELAPLSPWAVDFGEDRCRLARTFGDADNKHVAIFDQFGPSARFVLTLAGPSFRRFKGQTETMTKFAKPQEPFATQPYAGDLGAFGRAVIFRGLALTKATALSDSDQSTPSATSNGSAFPLLNIDAAKSTEFISLRQRHRHVRLNTGELGDAFQLLNECTLGLVESWGLDAQAHLTAQRLPNWVNEEEIAKGIASRYPNKALRRGQSGFVNLRVMVSETGSITQCVVENVTDANSLESPACDGMRDAEFEPAIDAQGNPMASFYQTRITYRIN